MPSSVLSNSQEGNIETLIGKTALFFKRKITCYTLMIGSKTG